MAEDPIQKLLIGRDPLAGAALASQPTLSRFANAPRRAVLYRMGEALAESVIERHRRRLGGSGVKHITIDLDPTESEPWPRIGRPPRHDVEAWTVTDDWPDPVPITEAELDVFEAWFGDFFDELFGPHP